MYDTLHMTCYMVACDVSLTTHHDANPEIPVHIHAHAHVHAQKLYAFTCTPFMYGQSLPRSYMFGPALVRILRVRHEIPLLEGAPQETQPLEDLGRKT